MDVFIEARRVYSQPITLGEIRARNHCSLHQAEHMAGFSGITITLEQEHVYVYLRNYNETEKKSDFSIETGIEPRGLGDKNLFAEVLLLTGDTTNYISFIEKYPHIFRNNGIIEPRSTYQKVS